MEHITQVHNIGIFLQRSNDDKWNKLISANLKKHFDGFEIFENNITQNKIVVKNYNELNFDSPGIEVPGDTLLLDDGIFISYHYNIAYRETENTIEFWAKDEVWFITYMLDKLFQKSGITFVHGAGISYAGKGKLLLAFGGIGKTSFISNALKLPDTTLLGDDLILVSKEGTLLSFPRPFCLYEYHRELFPDYFKDKKYKFIHCEKEEYFKRAMRKIRRKYNMVGNRVYDYLTVSPLNLMERDKIQIAPVALSEIYILRRRKGINNIQISECDDMHQAVNFAQNVIIHEWDLNFKLLLNEKTQNCNSIFDILERQKNIIEANLKHASSIQFIDIPYEIDSKKTSILLTEKIIKRG